MKIMLWLLLAACFTVCLLAFWRFLTKRAGGTQVIMRRLPAKESHGWRHGVIRYKGDMLEFYKLRSLSPHPDIVLRRDELVLNGRREKTGAEQKFMEERTRIVQLKSSTRQCEWALNSHAEMALLAWLESAPTRPVVRTHPREAMKFKTRQERRRS